MARYANRSGRSGVTKYDAGRGFVTVHFKDGSTYKYTNGVTGRHAVGRMRDLARRGPGLNGYINKSVAKYRYASKS